MARHRRQPGERGRHGRRHRAAGHRRGPPCPRRRVAVVQLHADGDVADGDDRDDDHDIDDVDRHRHRRPTTSTTTSTVAPTTSTSTETSTSAAPGIASTSSTTPTCSRSPSRRLDRRDDGVGRQRRRNRSPDDRRRAGRPPSSSVASTFPARASRPASGRRTGDRARQRRVQRELLVRRHRTLRQRALRRADRGLDRLRRRRHQPHGRCRPPAGQLVHDPRRGSGDIRRPLGVGGPRLDRPRRRFDVSGDDAAGAGYASGRRAGHAAARFGAARRRHRRRQQRQHLGRGAGGVERTTPRRDVQRRHDLAGRASSPPPMSTPCSAGGRRPA